MAFYQDDDENQQDPNVQQGPQQTAPSSSVIGGSGAPGGAPGGAPQSSLAPDKPGNFVGIKQYLDANKTQAAKLGDQTAGVINNSANDARAGVQALNQEAQDKVKTVNSLDPGVSSKLQNGAETLSNDERNTVKNTAGARYTGPAASTDLNSYQAAADKTQKATTNLGNAGTEEGRMNLVTQINSKPRTQGINVFDNALLQAGGGREKVEQAAAANQGVTGGLTAANQAINSQIGRADDPSTPDVDESTGAIGQTNKAQADAYKQIQDALGNWQTGFQPKVQQAQNDFTSQQQKVSSDIGDNPYQLDEDTMSLLGLSRGDRAYNLDFNKYLNPGSPSDINAGNVASAEDYARYGALSDLAGVDPTVLNPANASQAGTAPKFGANTEQLKTDMGQAAAKYNTNYNQSTDVVKPEFAPKDPQAQKLFNPANWGFPLTPANIENIVIPYIRNRNVDNFPVPIATGSGSDVFNEAEKAFEGAMDDWRKNQGYDNVVNGYGLSGNMTQQPVAGIRIRGLK